MATNVPSSSPSPHLRLTNKAIWYFCLSQAILHHNDVLWPGDLEREYLEIYNKCMSASNEAITSSEIRERYFSPEEFILIADLLIKLDNKQL